MACVPPNRYTLEEVTRLTQMVEGFLILTPADSGHADLNNSAFSATGFVEEVVELLQLLAAERHQRVTIQGDASIMPHANSVLMQRALSNILKISDQICTAIDTLL